MFWSRNSCIVYERKTKDCAQAWTFHATYMFILLSLFAPLIFAGPHNHSPLSALWPLLTIVAQIHRYPLMRFRSKTQVSLLFDAFSPMGHIKTTKNTDENGGFPKRFQTCGTFWKRSVSLASSVDQWKWRLLKTAPKKASLSVIPIGVFRTV